MELDSRKMIILKTIIKTYLETGEPVGSRTISKEAELNLSSATIRNEMADLEEMGLIIQPHTSAGRIPTDQGYRLYVDELMEEKTREIGDFKDFINARMDQVDTMLKRMAKILASNTNYATMISAPRYTDNELKLIQLSRLDSGHIVAVIVVEGNFVKNTIIDTEMPISNNEILQLNVLLNSALQGKTLNDITLSLVRALKDQAGEYSEVIGPVIEAVMDTITESKQAKPEIYMSGTTNIFKYPELTEGTRASDLISTFEERDPLLELVSDRPDTDHQIQVYIGQETPVMTMRDCSVVTANYELGKGMRGTIGIIGPKRMDYERVVSTLKTVMSELDRIYHDNF